MAEPTVHANADDAGQDGFYGWDWSATTHQRREEFRDRPSKQVQEYLDALGTHTALPGKGLQGWPLSVQGYDGEGFLLGTVYFGGSRGDLHVLSTSSAADNARRAVASLDGAKTSRVDTRVDTLAEFDSLLSICRAAADMYGSEIVTMEKEVKRESAGRTIYLGSPRSAIRVRCYEKHLESPGQYVEGTNRVEVQLRPPSKTKERVSGWTPAETFCASRTTRDLAARLGATFRPEVSVRVKKGTPDLQRTLEAMGNQYGNAVERFLNMTGGDVGTVLDYLTGPAKPDHGYAQRWLDENRKDQ